MKTLLVFFLALLPVAAAAQPIPISLAPHRARLVEAGFSVEQVIDARRDTTSLGRGYRGMTNRPAPVVLKGGTAAEVLGYLQRSIQPAPGAIEVVVRIDTLIVEENRSFMGEAARAVVGLSFLRSSPEGTLEVVGAEVGLGERPGGMDATSKLDDVLHEALQSALHKFEASTRAPHLAAAPESEPMEQEEPATIPERSATQMVQKLEAHRDSLAGTRRQVVLASALAGSGAKGGGISYMMYSDRPGGWLMPLVLSVNVLAAERELKGGRYEGIMVQYGGTLAGICRFHDSPLALMVDGMISGGSERLEGAGKERFFFGGQLGQSILVLPRDTGLVMSLGAYQSVFAGSDLYPRDLGFRLRVGVQF